MCRYKKFLLVILFFLPVFTYACAEEIFTWQDCIREAAKNHPDLIAAQKEVKQSEAAKDATASGLYPQIESSLSASTAKTSSATSGSSTADSYSYGVSASQLVFDAGKTLNNVNAGKEDIKVAKENFRFTSATVRYRLRSAFVRLLRAQEMQRITQEIFDIRRSNLELITLRYQSGLEHKGALLTAEADSNEAKYEIDQAKRELEVARRDLAKEMGRIEMLPLEVNGDFQVKDSAEEKPDFLMLTKNNPSLQELIAKRNSAEFSLKSTYADFFPNITGQAGTDKSGNHWSPKNNGWNLGLSLNLPIFEGGLRLAQVSQAKALVDQLKANEESTRDGVILDLEETWALLQDAIDNVGVQKEMLNATEERSKIAQAQYSIGFMTFDNWIIIEDNLVKAKRAYLDAQAAALYAEAGWIQAKGETLEYD